MAITIIAGSDVENTSKYPSSPHQPKTGWRWLFIVLRHKHASYMHPEGKASFSHLLSGSDSYAFHMCVCACHNWKDETPKLAPWRHLRLSYELFSKTHGITSTRPSALGWQWCCGTAKYTSGKNIPFALCRQLAFHLRVSLTLAGFIPWWRFVHQLEGSCD